MFIFVYGTLKRGFPNSHMLNSSKFIEERCVRGLKMVNLGWYPGCVVSSNDDKVHGEVYEVTEEIINKLDRLEGVPFLYRRYEIEKGLQTYIYNKSVEEREVIEDGIWKY
jgi:gamma-glutamylaminecyclotransferase